MLGRKINNKCQRFEANLFAARSSQQRILVKQSFIVIPIYGEEVAKSIRHKMAVNLWDT